MQASRLFNLSENRGEKHDRINEIAVESGNSEEVAQAIRHPNQRCPPNYDFLILLFLTRLDYKDKEFYLQKGNKSQSLENLVI